MQHAGLKSRFSGMDHFSPNTAPNHGLLLAPSPLPPPTAILACKQTHQYSEAKWTQGISVHSQRLRMFIKTQMAIIEIYHERYLVQHRSLVTEGLPSACKLLEHNAAL